MRVDPLKSASKAPETQLWRSALLLPAALLASLGCHQEGITHYRVPKDTTQTAPSAPVAAPAEPMGNPGAVPPPPVPTGNAALKWALPKGWMEEKSGGMRYATLKAPGAGKLDISVVFLPGAAGGELANVNRWRGQIGLPSLDEAALGKARTALKTKAGPVAAFDFTSEGQAKTRMVVGLLTTADGNSWFLKMVGDEAPVAKNKSDFMRFLESLRLD
jgi:hypothetical protein